ncbi:MAG TPA: hypothetical protein VLG92_03015 [Candidatus Saccharimonadia bacterium]|nr:hypothetical protein [Candidatus Saccharimonadia bacterium]
MDNRQAQAVERLRNAKSQGLSYYDATQSLAKQGFTQEEIKQASYRFPYNEAAQTADSTSSSATADQVFAEAVVHEEAIDNARQELHKDVAKGLLGGRSIFGGYYQNKAIGDYTALKDLEQGKSLDSPNDVTQNANSGNRVFQRNRAIRIYAFLSLIPLLFLTPYFILMFPNLSRVVDYLFHHHTATAFASVGMYLWSAGGYIAYISIALVLFFAHKESTIIRTIYAVIGADLALFVLFAILFKSPVFLGFGVISVLPALWISRRVGLLMQLS